MRQATCLVTGALLTLALTGQVAAEGIDDLALKDFQEACTTLEACQNKISAAVQNDFAKFVGGLLKGERSPDAIDLGDAGKDLTKLLSDLDPKLDKSGLSPAKVEGLERCIKRAEAAGNKEYVTNGKAAISKRDELSSAVDLLRANAKEDKDAKKQTLAPGAFGTLAQEEAKRLLGRIELLRQIDVEKAGIEDFLTDVSKPVWERIEEGKGAPFSGRKRRIYHILDQFKKGYTYNTRNLIEEAVKKYPKESTERLLMAAYLLINKSDPEKMREGFEYLKEAHAELHTERLAFVLAKVGARTGKLDEKVINELIDHTTYSDQIPEKLKNLPNLYNFCMIYYLRRKAPEEARTAEQIGDNFAKAKQLLSKVRKSHQTAGMVSPSLVFILYLHEASFDQIGDELAGDKLVLELWEKAQTP